MSRARSDTILSGAPRVPRVQCDVLEAVGQYGAKEYTAGGAGITINNDHHSSPSHGAGGGHHHHGRGDVATHDLYGDYDSDAGGDDASPAPSASTPSAASPASSTTPGVRVTGQTGFVLRSDGGGASSPNASAAMTVNRWSVENNVALLVLKKELQIDRSAVRERRTAKRLADLQTPRQLAGSMSFHNGVGGATPRSGGGAHSCLATPRGSLGSATPRGLIGSPRVAAMMALGSGNDWSAAMANANSNGYGGGDQSLLYAPPPPITVTMTDATALSAPLRSEVDFLLQKLSELVSVAGLQEGEDTVGSAKQLHRRVQLLDGRVVEELSNRVDATIASIDARSRTRDLIAQGADMTEKEMAAAYELSGVVDECFAAHSDALQIIRRLHGLRLLHQEAFQRVGAMSLLRAATSDTNAFVASALDEIEEMRLGTKEVDGAVNESLAYFRTRLQGLAAIK